MDEDLISSASSEQSTPRRGAGGAGVAGVGDGLAVKYVCNKAGVEGEVKVAHLKQSFKSLQDQINTCDALKRKVGEHPDDEALGVEYASAARSLSTQAKDMAKEVGDTWNYVSDWVLNTQNGTPHTSALRACDCAEETVTAFRMAISNLQSNEFVKAGRVLL